MNGKLNLILCAQAHLPSGSGEAEFESLYNIGIKPLVSALDKFPRVNMTLYYSGVILYWIERRHPELFMLIEDLLSRKQIEFLGGGFYDPMLAILPVADKIGQIEMLTTYLRKHFGKRPQGCWLPAMAWDQSLVGPLNSCGMSYTFLEDKQFSGAGAKPDDCGIFSPCITEDQGKLLTVFPVAQADNSREWTDGRKAGGRLLVLPVASSMSSEKGYENFFKELSDAENRIEFTCPSKVIKNLIPPKKVYFPGVWVSNDSNCSNPRQFLADHPEAGGIYAKMIYVQTLIKNQLRGDKTRKRTALEELWKAQDSGVFRLGTPASPGLLHSPVRKAAYRSLLEAEKITREKGKFSPSLLVFDFDLDGIGEYLFQDDKMNCCLKSRGGGIFELDYLPAAWNYLDTLHSSAGKQDDGYRKSAFVDWLAPAGTAPGDLGPDGIRGGRFCGNEEYDVSETDRVRRRLGFTLPPKAGLPWGEIEIEKNWQLRKNTLTLEYVLKNTGVKSAHLVFCPQFELSFPGEGEGFLRILSITDDSKETLASGDISIGDAHGLEFQDIKNEALISFESSRGFDAKIFSFRAGINGQAGGQDEYQSTCVMPILTVFLEGGKTWKTSFSLKISS